MKTRKNSFWLRCVCLRSLLFCVGKQSNHSPPPPAFDSLAFIFVIICCQSGKIQLGWQCVPVHRQKRREKKYDAMSNALQYYHIVYLCHCLLCVNSFLAVAVVIYLIRVCRMRRILMFTDFICINIYIFFAIYLFIFGFSTIYRSTEEEVKEKSQQTHTESSIFSSAVAPSSHYFTCRNRLCNQTKQTKHKPRWEWTMTVKKGKNLFLFFVAGTGQQQKMVRGFYFLLPQTYI